MKCLCYHHNERCQSYFRLGLRMGFKLTVFNSIKKYKNENSTQNLFKARLNSILAKVALQRFEKKTLICWLTRLWILKLPMSVWKSISCQGMVSHLGTRTYSAHMRRKIWNIIVIISTTIFFSSLFCSPTWCSYHEPKKSINRYTLD